MSTQGTILLAVFRPDPDLLRRQVTSLKCQTMRDWECVVGIDGTDPETHELVDALVADDARFRVLDYPQRVGHYSNFERLSEEAPPATAWVAYCDQDDYWYPEKLARLLALLGASPMRKAVVGAARIVDTADTVLGTSHRSARSFAQLFLKNEVTGSFAVLRRDVLNLALPFPEPTRSAVHDHWLGVCATALGDVHFSSELLQDYVQHGGNVIGETRQSTIRSHAASARKAGGVRIYLDSMSREQWGWRVSMARTLRDRLPVDTEHSGFLDAVAAARPTVTLFSQMAAEVRGGRLPLRTAIGLGVAASWAYEGR